jgi:hypothetical protein
MNRRPPFGRGGMRNISIRLDYHSGEAEIAGKRSLALVAGLAGYLEGGGLSDIRFIDAMTYNLSKGERRACGGGAQQMEDQAEARP